MPASSVHSFTNSIRYPFPAPLARPPLADPLQTTCLNDRRSRSRRLAGRACVRACMRARALEEGASLLSRGRCVCLVPPSEDVPAETSAVFIWCMSVAALARTRLSPPAFRGCGNPGPPDGFSSTPVRASCTLYPDSLLPPATLYAFEPVRYWLALVKLLYATARHRMPRPATQPCADCLGHA
jgi:hypothetical protein